MISETGAAPAIRSLAYSLLSRTVPMKIVGVPATFSPFPSSMFA